MDKNAIKKYAVWARRELIAKVKLRVDRYEISKDADPSAETIRGQVLNATEKVQRAALIKKVQEKGIEQVIEEVAYTWFNRFIALRFMEVNEYLPSAVRVFTNANNEFKPQILSDALTVEFDGIDRNKVIAYKEANQTEELYKYLLIVQCNALNSALPSMFQKINDYTELLFPDNLLREESIIEKLVADISEDDWNVNNGGQIEILGWMYQYYISEKHDKVIDPLHGKFVSKDEVPAATALFTTDWVIRYIVDNSVGRYWIERNPDSNLKNKLEYFVMPKKGSIPYVHEKITPEQLTIFDPAMGSAHFGIYAFEVLMKIYTEYGYTEREAAASIVQKNLFGLDIDDRSAQIANFAIMMKAMQYDKCFLIHGIQSNFYSIQDSNGISKDDIEYFANGNEKLKKNITSIVNDFIDAKEYGSILQISVVDYASLYQRFDEIRSCKSIDLYSQIAIDKLFPLVRVAEVMTTSYAIIDTNPPYLNKYDAKLKDYLNNRYKDYSGDLFSVFMYRALQLCNQNGYVGFMTPFVWMFIKTYEKLRKYIIDTKSISTLIQFEYSAFEEATVPICSFVIKNSSGDAYGSYFRLTEFSGGMEIQRQKVLAAIQDKTCGYYYESIQNSFENIPGSPIAYWASPTMIRTFLNGIPLGSIADSKQGLATTDNKKFLRLWHELPYFEIHFNVSDIHEAFITKGKWFPYNKGGAFRKWYGNNDYVVNYENDGEEIKSSVLKKYPYLKTPDFVVKNTDYYFHRCFSWSLISSSVAAFRYKQQGFIFDVAGMSCFSNSNLYYLLALCNSVIVNRILAIIAPTINYQCGDIANIPVIIDKDRIEEIEIIVRQNIAISKNDWDSFEISWDFKRYPLVILRDQYNGINSDIFNEYSNNFDIRKVYIYIDSCYERMKENFNNQFNKLKANEEILNRSFIEIYNLQNELPFEEDESEITVHYIADSQDTAPESLKNSTYLLTKVSIIKNLISYAVGCMFGRYSLDEEGLVYAGGKWDPRKYTTFSADKDNIIPITDDEYFTDDIVNKFIMFIATVYGSETLEENIEFIADSLGGKGTPKEVIRNYFLNDFFTDHCKIYQKRPIYWLFNSGKKNGFKALIYMHRYQPDTLARMRTDYVHEQQSRYRTAIEDVTHRLELASGSEHARLNKQLIKLTGQAEELQAYEEKLHHLADQYISIDLDDGVKYNYEIFKDVLAPIK